MILFFDTETTGLVKFGQPLKSQPHMAQLGAALYDFDGTERGALSCIISPDGWVMPEEVAKIHGLSQDVCLRAGLHLKRALALLTGFMQSAELLVAHNINFDLTVLQAALTRVGYSEATLLAWTEMMARMESHCTMDAATNVCRLPKARGQGYKWPKLSEAYKFFFDEELLGAHDALVDVRACARIYFHMRDKGI